MNQNIKSAIQSVLDPIEYNIDLYKRFYLDNKKISRTSLLQLIKEFEAINSETYISQTELNKINASAENLIYHKPTLANFNLISKVYLKKRKEDAFDKKEPPLKNTQNIGILMESLRSSRRAKACEVSSDEFLKESLIHKIDFLKKLCNCLIKFGLRDDLIPNRPEESKLYNVYIKHKKLDGKEQKDVLILLSRQNLLEHYVEPYNKGYSIMFNGVTLKSENINAIRVSYSKYKKDEIPLFLKTKGHIFDENKSASRIKYFNECEPITDEFINTKNSIINKTTDDFIFPERMEELLNISSPNYDLKKLIQLCKEINIAHKNDMRFAKASLIRATCDHIPPIFGMSTFEQVASNYRADGNSRSFKGAVKKLHDFFKHVSDGILHSQARQRESLPTKEQLNVSQELDFLLQEVCRLLK